MSNPDLDLELFLLSPSPHTAKNTLEASVVSHMLGTLATSVKECKWVEVFEELKNELLVKNCIH